MLKLSKMIEAQSYSRDNVRTSMLASTQPQHKLNKKPQNKCDSPKYINSRFKDVWKKKKNKNLIFKRKRQAKEHGLVDAGCPSERSAAPVALTLTTVTRPSLLLGSVWMAKRPVGSPPLILYTAFQAGVWGWSLSVTVRLATMTSTRFSGTSP